LTSSRAIIETAKALKDVDGFRHLPAINGEAFSCNHYLAVRFVNSVATAGEYYLQVSPTNP
jgi:hypothetical protein